jgi:hypothetical protein
MVVTEAYKMMRFYHLPPYVDPRSQRDIDSLLQITYDARVQRRVKARAAEKEWRENSTGQFPAFVVDKRK